MPDSKFLTKLCCAISLTSLSLLLASCGGGGTAGSADTTSPSTPTGLTASAASTSQINLSWTASTDNVGVTAYRIYRDGVLLTTLSNVTSYQNTGLSASTAYSYTVQALDAAGNASAQSAAANATTLATPDVIAPSTPIGLTATAASTSQINLSWMASTDNVGVTGYRIYRDSMLVAAQGSVTSYQDTGLSASTTYSYTVQALDAAGNASAQSAAANATTLDAGGGSLPLGALTVDGPATPEQISLFLPLTGVLPQTATATVRYKATSSSTWITGHALYRIRPDLSDTPGVGTVPDAFAWPIIDVLPGTSYDIEVTVTSGSTVVIKTLTTTTRALPAAAGAPNKTANSVATIASQFAALNPGDVLEIANGTYAVSGLQLNRSGTANNPIYIRGASRSGVVLSNSGRILQILDASHVVIENLTMQGSGVDSGTNASSKGIEFYDGSPTQTRVTVRNITITGVDVGIKAWHEIAEFLAYDNTLIGNNTWTPALIDSNATWNDDGINIPGFGNSVFNNTLRGFGDTFACESAQLVTDSVSIHFYRNDVPMGGDDGFEGDGAHRNITFYDNRLRNTMTFLSLDPLFGGPLVMARNITINTGRTPFKWNSTNAGQFIYNNTIIRTTSKYWVESPGTAAEAGWYQPNNGDQRAYGYQNNILIYLGLGSQTIRLDNSGHDPVDFNHNSWYPDAVFQWPSGTFSNLAGAYSGLSATSPVFSGISKRHEADNITVSNPWTAAVTLGSDYHTEVTTAYTPALAGSTAPKNSGVTIPNITDGFSGGAPDRGAIISGRTIPQYGDRLGP